MEKAATAGQVRIYKDKIATSSWTDDKGKTSPIYKQDGYLYVDGEPHPQLFTFRLPEPVPVPVGLYDIKGALGVYNGKLTAPKFPEFVPAGK